MQFPLPAFVCDVGGTNCRIAPIADAHGPGSPIHVKTADFPGLAEAIEAAAVQFGLRPQSVVACGAGPASGKVLKLTNAPWTMDGDAVAKALGLRTGLLLNDFEAQALSLPAIPPEWLHVIGPDLPRGHGARIILGPGTGLGIAALVEVEGKVAAVPSEACHASFGPVGPEEEALWPYLERAHGRVTAESVISGPGLVRVHRALAAMAGRPEPALDGAAIVSHALAEPGSPEREACRWFWRLVARFAGDMAITFIAEGGVTLAGGVLPRIASLVDPAEFRATFEAKAPVEALARRVSTALVVHDDSVIAGMAAIVAKPQAYAIDYAARAWG